MGNVDVTIVVYWKCSALETLDINIKMNKEINMRKKYNIITGVTIIKKVEIFAELLVLFLVICSSMAMAYTGFSEENKSSDIHKNIVTQTEFSPKFGLAPENHKFTEYQNRKPVYKTTHSPVGHRSGFTPSPVNLSHLKHTPVAAVYASASTSPPTSYDLRTLNRVTPVENQGSAGVCWTFATYGSLESYLMPGETWSFSENNIKNVLSSANSPQGFDRGPNDGGNYFMSTAYLARGNGPVNTSNDPYSATSKFSSKEIGLPVNQHVQNITFLPNRNGPTDNLGIKKAIMTNGGVATAMYFDPYDTTIYNQNTYGYYYNGTTPSDHAVTIVGWDDSFSKNNFSTTPPGNGAFIIKNSWGTTAADWGNVNNANGYFYVSYYDSDIGYDMNTQFTAENPNDYANIYQYDPLGWTQQISTSQTNPITGWGANIFTAKSNEVLKAVSFYTTDLNCNYVINIYNNTGSNPISQAGPVLTQSGTIPNAGYNTVPLNSGVKLNAGKNFSVVLKLTNPAYNYPIAVEMPISGYSSQAKANASESFVSSDGSSWTDITTQYPNTDVCIKAFTNPQATTPKQAPAITWNNPTAMTYGTKLSDTQLDATASVAGKFVYTPAAGTVLSVGTQTLTATFTPTDSTNYSTVSKSVSITVNKATPTITWNNPMAITYGTKLSRTQLDATASVSGTFIYTPAAGTVLSADTQTLTVTFTPTDSTNYSTVSKSVSITINKATSRLTWNNPTAITYGTKLSNVQLNIYTSVPGTFIYTPALGTVLGKGTQTVTTTFTPTDSTNYSTVSKSVSITVNKATPTITWNNPADTISGTPLSNVQLNPYASVPGTFIYTPAAGTVLSAGTQTLTATFTPTDSTNYSTVSKSVTTNVVTPMQKIDQMITFVQGITTSGDLDEGSYYELTSILKAAEKSLDRIESDPMGNKLAVTVELNAFIDQVNEYINSGILPSTKGHILIDSANDIINVLSNQVR
jgi:C1A family cysteine protease